MTTKSLAKTSETPAHTVPADRASFSMRGGSPAVLLIHGFTGDTREMRPLADLFNARGLHVVAPLLKGHGGPPHLLENVTVEDWLAQLRVVLSELTEEHSSVIVCGFSLGGALAAMVAAELIESERATGLKVPLPRAQALIAIAPMIAINNPAVPFMPLVKRFMKWFYPLRIASLDQLKLRQQINEVDPSLNLDDPKVVAVLRDQIRIPVAIVDDLRKSAAWGIRSAARVTVPTLVLQGMIDIVVSPIGAQRFFNALAAEDKQFKTFEEGAHDLPKPGNRAHQHLLDTITAWMNEREKPLFAGK